MEKKVGLQLEHPLNPAAPSSFFSMEHIVDLGFLCISFFLLPNYHPVSYFKNCVHFILEIQTKNK